MKSLKTFLLLAVTIFATSSCSAEKNTTVKDQLAKAKDNNNMVLMVVTDKNNSAEKMNGLVKESIKDLQNITIVQMSMDDEKNADLVKEYKLSGAPMPVLLLFSNKGLMLGGMVEAQVTKEAIVDAIPTPKYSDITFALSQGKPVFAVVSNNKFKSDKSARELCESAKKEMTGKAEIIVIDAEDAKESKLISMLNIKNKLEDTFIIAINGQGIMSGRFDVIPAQTELVAAATKVVQSGCAPGGCTPTCK
ncbi:hypothetical protein [Bacteroides neonati]|uniref:hypothetical protein n=1 Tax=Bacteroides neonati TaxID=1347393 RepID=UPI0004B3F3E2|nr:hypothetical protein [Bacteroides neonati]